MVVEIKDLSEKSLDDHPCFKYCKTTEGTRRITKDWLRKVYSIFGSCVKVAYVDGSPVAMVQYSPMDIFPHATHPNAHETILIHCVYVADKKHEGKGLARMLLKSLIKDLRKPHPYLQGGKFRRIAALAGKGRPGPAAPLSFFVKMGFKPIKEHKNDVLVGLEL